MKGISFLFLLVSCAAPFKPKDPLKATFHEKDFLYRQCYHESDSYKGRHLDEERLMDVGFQIKDNGHVSQAVVLKSDFKDRNLEACVLGIVRNLRFYDLDHSTDTTQTINFGHTQL